MAEETPPTTSKSRMDSNRMGHPVFGDLLEKFPGNRLPTFLQVLNRVRFLKSQASSPRDPLRGIYNLVATELSTIWMEAFVVPILNIHNLTTNLQTNIEKKINSVRQHFGRIVNSPEKLTAEISEMKTVYSITKCRCFLKTQHRQDVISSNCHCDNPIVNLECYGDQLFGFNQIIVFEEEKAVFSQKIAEIEAKSLPTPPKDTPPSTTDSTDAGYGKKFLATKRGRPISFGDLDDVEMEDPVQNEVVNYDTVLETMLAQGLKPFAIMKIISKFP